MVLWRSQADEIDALRAEVRNLRGEMAAQQAGLEEMDSQKRNRNWLRGKKSFVAVGLRKMCAR
jgi:hypothetical protein